MRRILHFGPGNFFRAHLAEYAFDAGGWEVVAVSLRSSGFRDAWRAQGFYTLAVQGQPSKRIDVIRDVRVAPEDPRAVLAAIADPSTEVISATVTEKGYHLGADGILDLDAPEIAADLAERAPRTLVGFLAHGLADRQAPVTVLSCDNRTGNGDALRAAVARFTEAAGLTLRCDARFPNAMVDRITPATTEALIAETGDPLAVPCEPFKEWVIEDDFAGARPTWPGIQWVPDVHPYELRKLRMLNGAHSYLAYTGCLAGYNFVHEAIADPGLRAGVIDLMAEAAETLPATMRAQAAEYAAALLTRFENPHLAHALRQIAMDGTEKLPYRIVASLRARLPKRSPALAAGLRAWIAFCQAETAAGRLVNDPRADAIAAAEGPDALLRLIGAEDLEARLLE